MVSIVTEGGPPNWPQTFESRHPSQRIRSLLRSHQSDELHSSQAKQSRHPGRNGHLDPFLGTQSAVIGQWFSVQDLGQLSLMPLPIDGGLNRFTQDYKVLPPSPAVPKDVVYTNIARDLSSREVTEMCWGLFGGFWWH